LKGLKDRSNDMKPIVGKQVNDVRYVLTTAFEETAQKVAAEKIQQQLASETMEVTLPGRQVKVGKRQDLTQTTEDIED
ncbi:phenylalanine--tRNA ligase subunit alpha, partial [Streptococcus suis]